MTGVPLSQVGRIVTGKTPRTSVSDFFGGETPFVTPSDMDERRTIVETARTLSEKGVQSVRNCVIPKGAIMVSCIGSDMGKAHIAGARSVTNQQINTVIVDDLSFEPMFVYYNLFGRRAELRELAAGAAQPILNKTEFGKIIVDFPSREEQKSIAELLGALDDKIELNRKMAATLEEMARALYRSWFVDFDPVHAKAQGRAPAHMDPTTAALFPDRFGEDGLPEGWEMRSIYEFAQVQYGAAFKSSLFNTKGEGRPLVRIRDLKNHAAGVYTTETHKKEYLIQSGDTVVGMDGDFTSYTWCNKPALMNQRVCSFLPRVAENRSFVRHGLVPQLKAEEEAAVATTVIHLGKKDIDKFVLPAPSVEVLEAFSSLVEPLTDRFVKLGLENITLAQLRDTLLPKLMSGELRIREAEKQIEEVV